MCDRQGPCHILDVWTSFAQCKYKGEGVERFCFAYQAALDHCASMDIIIQDKIKVVQFVGGFVPYFEQWAFSKRDQMRRDPTNLPSLDSLMEEITYEDRSREGGSLYTSNHQQTRQLHLLHLLWTAEIEEKGCTDLVIFDEKARDRIQHL